jgi:tetratricopeptide (TPR) repeat protein
MLQKWIDSLRRKPNAGTAPLDPRAAAARAAKRLVAIERPLHVAIASDDPAVRHGAHDVLESLAPAIHVARLEDAEGLGAELQLRELDLVVLDVRLDDGLPGSDSPWARLERARPRVPVIAIVGPEAPEVDARHGDVVATIDAASPSFGEKLAKAAASALTAHEARRVAAAKALESALERAGTHPATGARALVEAYRTGDLGGEARRRLREALVELAAKLAENAPERADALAVLAADAFDRHDEVGLIYHATLLAEAAPARAAEAEAWLARRDELVTELYAAVDRRLEHVMVLRRIGRFRQVLREGEAIQGMLANVLPAHHLEAEALRNEGELQAAIAVYDRIADLSLQNGEVDRARQALSLMENLDTEGTAAKRLAERRAAIAQIEDALQDPSALPRYPCLRVCHRVMCQEAAELSRGFFVVDPDGECDVCDLGILGRIEALHGRTIAVIGGRLGRFYEDALRELGAAHVLHHDAITEPQKVPQLVARADAVVLVAGAATHWGLLKAERELARAPRPAVRVHFYGVRQVARAVALDLAPRLAGEAGTGTGRLTERLR